MSDKSTEAFRTISEVAKELGLATHVLRFWESKFPQIKPLKRAGGRRYYRPDDVDFLRRLQVLLHDEGYTIKGAQKLVREEGTRRLKEQGAEIASQISDKADEAEEEIAPEIPASTNQASLFDSPTPVKETPSLFAPQNERTDTADEPGECPEASLEVEEANEPERVPAVAIETVNTPPKFFLPDAPEPTAIPEPEAVIRTEIVEKISETKKKRLTGILEELEEIQRLLSDVA